MPWSFKLPCNLVYMTLFTSFENVETRVEYSYKC